MLFSIERTNSIKLISRLVFSLFTLLVLSCSSSTKIADNTVSKMAKYEYGQDRSFLMEFEDKVNASVYSETKRSVLEAKLIDLLSGEATFASKQFACRQLRVIGSEKSLPVLSDLLLDAKTNDIARFALERIPGNSVGETLINSIGSVSKDSQLGIINTLGVGRSQKAVTALSKLMNNFDSDISIAAAYALGKIGNAESAEQLNSYSTKAKGQLKNAILDSYLSCADNLVSQNKYEVANGIYTDLYNKDIPEYLKKAALVGIINTSNNKSNEIFERISNEPSEMKSVAISKIGELTENNDITKFAKLMLSLSPTNQVQMLSVIEDIADKKSKPFVLNTLKSDIVDIRIGSIKALANIGDETDILTIAKIAAKTSGDEVDYARSTLNLLKGRKVDEGIISNLSDADDDVKVELIRTAGGRNIKSAFDNIINLTKSDNRKIRSEAFTALAEISTDKNIPVLTDLLLNISFESDRKKAERTIVKIIQKSKNKYTTLLLDGLKTNNVENKCSLLHLLGNTNDARALQLLRKEIKNENPKIKLAAIYGLSSWSNAEPLEDLINVVESENNQTTKSAALKGFTNFIEKKKNLSAPEKLALYQKSLKFAKTGNERNIALDGIGHIDSFESLETFKSYLNQDDVKETVDDGINRVSWHLFKNNPEKVKIYVLDFLEKVKNEEFQNKNKELVKAIDRHIKKRDTK